MNDVTNKKLKVGQTVDMQLIGMFRGTVVAVNDSVIAIPGQQPMLPHIIVDFHIPKFMAAPDQPLQCIYVVHEPTEEEMKNLQEAIANIETAKGKPS